MTWIGFKNKPIKTMLLLMAQSFMILILSLALSHLQTPYHFSTLGSLLALGTSFLFWNPSLASGLRFWIWFLPFACSPQKSVLIMQLIFISLSEVFAFSHWTDFQKGGRSFRLARLGLITPQRIWFFWSGLLWILTLILLLKRNYTLLKSFQILCLAGSGAYLFSLLHSRAPKEQGLERFKSH